MVIENLGDIQAGAGVGALMAVTVLLRPCVCTLGVFTADGPGVPEGPRDGL